MKSCKVSIKTRSTPASLSFKGQATKQPTVKWSIVSSLLLLAFKVTVAARFELLKYYFFIILYAQSFDTYNVIHARTYLMEKKIIPLSELCVPSDITLIEQVGN